MYFFSYETIQLWYGLNKSMLLSITLYVSTCTKYDKPCYLSTIILPQHFFFLSSFLLALGACQFYQLQCSNCGERQHVFLCWRQRTEDRHYPAVCLQNGAFPFLSSAETRTLETEFSFFSQAATPATFRKKKTTCTFKSVSCSARNRL